MMTDEFLIDNASAKDMPLIERFAKRFELDCEDLNYTQFIIAKKSETIIGFGRLRMHKISDIQMNFCYELATLGVVPHERKKGIGTCIIKELIRVGPPEIFITCVIPNFFEPLGFRLMKQYPPILQKKVDFCKMYDFKDDEIFIMKHKK